MRIFAPSLCPLVCGEGRRKPMKEERSGIQKILWVAALMMFATMGVMAQNENQSNLTGSPYSRYGLGRLGTVGNAATRSMGGLGTALRTSAFTNLANPASLTAIDTLTMIFDIGLNAEWAHFSEDGSHETSWNAGFDYMSFQFPLWNRFAMSMALTPYSAVGYEYGALHSEAIDSQISPNDTLRYTSTYNGMGGLQKISAGLGWTPYRSKRQELNVGADFGFIYGTVSHGGLIYINSGQGQSTIATRSFQARGFDATIGLQYTYRTAPEHLLTLGATFSPKMHLGIDAEVEKYSNTDTLSIRTGHSLGTPLKASAGVTYQIGRKLTAGIDCSFENWADVPGLDANLQKGDGFYQNVTRLAAGLEYQPAVYDQNYFRVCRYRAGLAAKNSYVEVYGSQNWEYTASVGIGFPVGAFSGRRSLVNLTLEYTRLQPKSSQMLCEDYVNLSFGFTFNEVMFFRGKLR